MTPIEKHEQVAELLSRLATVLMDGDYKEALIALIEAVILNARTHGVIGPAKLIEGTIVSVAVSEGLPLRIAHELSRRISGEVTRIHDELIDEAKAQEKETQETPN